MVELYTGCPNPELHLFYSTDSGEFPLHSATESNLTEAMSDSVAEGVIRYHNEWVKQGDQSRAELIRTENRMFFVNYGNVEIRVPIDWDLGQPGRDNLSWQLHSMFFLKDLVRAHKDTQDSWYIETALRLVDNWASENVGDNPRAFAWNDHSTAFRILALTMLFVYLKRSGLQTPSSTQNLLSLIGRHQRVLFQEKFYSKGTNHGLDQSFFLYISVAAIPKLNSSSEVKQAATNRLRYELTKSFAADGVHVENSPEYHDLILASVLKINKVIEDIEGKSIIDDYPQFCVKALRFLTFILRPDGCWPAIGDSTVRPPRNSYDLLQESTGYPAYAYARTKGAEGTADTDPHAVFPDAGYFVMRSRPGYLPHATRIHITFKCGFLNHYHRQDDDNHFVLFGFGEEWLTDGGLYKHDHTDPQREYIRSHQAHNVMWPEGRKARRRAFAPLPKIVSHSLTHDNAYCHGVSEMFEGFTFHRELYYDGEAEMLVFDSIVGHDTFKGRYFQDWQIPNDKSLELLDSKVIVRSTTSTVALHMSFEGECLVNVEDLSSDRGADSLANRSVVYGVLEPVRVLRVTFQGTSGVNATTTLTFSND